MKPSCCAIHLNEVVSMVNAPQTSSLNPVCMGGGSSSPRCILVKCLNMLPKSIGNEKNVVLARHVFVFSETVVRSVLLLRSFFCGQKNSQLSLTTFSFWCPEEDSNLHTLRHTDLNRARLPIPPSGQAMFLAEAVHFIVKGKFVNEK